MKKVLGIVASKRRLGNCEIVVKEISRQLKVPHQLKLLRLPDFELKYCNACYRCLKTGACVLKDDLDTVLEAIADADALILAAPTYTLAAHSSLKVFLDRSISFYGKADRLWRKRAVGIGVAGLEGKEGSTRLDIERVFSVLMTGSRFTGIVYGALPGEVLLREENASVVTRAAAALFGCVDLPKTWSCPLCGGETFRFIDGNSVRCMLCSERGAIEIRDGQVVPLIVKSDHHLFGDSDALQHEMWLKGMRDRFAERKEELKAVVARFQDDGTGWIRS